MKKKFVFQVAGYEWVDTEPFGEGWKEAKKMATELHTFIARLKIYKGEVKQEIFLKCGCFLNFHLCEPKDYYIF